MDNQTTKSEHADSTDSKKDYDQSKKASPKIDFQIKKLPKSELEITVTVPAEELEKHKKKAATELSKDIKIKGFRPGHVPAHILEEHINKDYLNGRAQEIAIQHSYAHIIITEKLQVVSRPQVEITSEDPLTYTAKVAVMPEVELKDHKSIKIKKEEPKVTEKDLDEVIEDMKRRGTLYTDVDRAAKKGDRVEVDFEGFDKEGKAVPNTKSANHPVIIGSNSLIPGFEDELIGLKKDEKKEFKIKFPKDYGKEDFQNKELTFKVEVKRIEEPKEPDFNDDLIEKMTGKKESVKDFKDNLKKAIQARKEEEAEKKRENDYLEELLKKAKVELPESLIDEEAEFILQDMKHDVVGKGLEFDKFLEQAKITEDDLRKKYRPEAEKRIKIRLTLHKVIQEEEIKVEESELRTELEKIKNFYPPAEHEHIQKEFDNGELKAQLSNRIALNKLFAKVLK